MVSFFSFVTECVNQSIYIVWCSCFWSFTRIYTWHSVFCIDPPAFVTSSVNPSSFKRAPAPVGTPCFLSLPLVVLESSTDSSALLLYHEKRVWPCHSSTVLQTSASFTDQKLRKENAIFKTIHLLTAETDVSMVLYPAVCRTSEIRPRWEIASDLTVTCSRVPFLFVLVSVEIKTIYLGYIYHSVFYCVSFANVEDTLPCFCK